MLNDPDRYILRAWVTFIVETFRLFSTRHLQSFSLIYLPVVFGWFWKFWFSYGPLPHLSTSSCRCLLCGLSPVHGPCPLKRVLRRVLCGHGGLRPAGGQGAVVLVVYIQLFPWTGAQTKDGLDVGFETICFNKVTAKKHIRFLEELLRALFYRFVVGRVTSRDDI